MTVYPMDAWLIYPGGSRVAYDREHLRSLIYEAFFLAGHAQDAWVTDEIINGVEFSIFSSRAAGQSTPALKFSALTDLVVHILLQSGYEKTAQTYRTLQSETVPDALDSLSHLLAVLGERFENWSPEALNHLAENVQAVLSRGGIRNPSDTLIYELALNRQFGAEAEVELPAPPVHLPKDGVPMKLLEQADLESKCSPELSKMLTQRILYMQPVGSLFPTVWINVGLCFWAESLNFKPVLTELALNPFIETLAERIHELYHVCNKVLKVQNPLPLNLTFIQSRDFACTFLGTENHDVAVRKSVQSVAGEIAAALPVPPYAYSLKL